MSKTTKIIVIIVVAAVVGGFCTLLILMALAVPAMQRINIQAHQTSAMQSLRMLNSAEAEYNGSYPRHGYACTLAQLGGNSAAGPPTPEAAQIIGDDLVFGNKAGYTFTIVCTNKTTFKNQDQYLGYRITAVPNSVGHSGNLGYCTDQDTLIKFDPRGGTNCTEVLQ